MPASAVVNATLFVSKLKAKQQRKYTGSTGLEGTSSVASFTPSRLGSWGASSTRSKQNNMDNGRTTGAESPKARVLLPNPDPVDEEAMEEEDFGKFETGQDREEDDRSYESQDEVTSLDDIQEDDVQSELTSMSKFDNQNKPPYSRADSPDNHSVASSYPSQSLASMPAQSVASLANKAPKSVQQQLEKQSSLQYKLATAPQPVAKQVDLSKTQPPESRALGTQRGVPLSTSKSFKDPEEMNRVSLKAPQEVIKKLQLHVREDLVYKHRRLDRFHLAERLLLEHKFVTGTARLFNQIAIFALFIVGLRLGSNESVKRGIYQNLNDIYGFTSLEAITDRDAFVSTGMPMIAQKSKQFFLLSSRYFEDSSQVAATELLTDLTVFSEPSVMAPMTLRAREFSFTAWVRTVPQFVEGYILQKRAAKGEEGASLSCWGWFLHSAYGQQLHFAAHDYFPSTGLETDVVNQLEVGLSTPMTFESNQYTLLTLVVREDNVTFYQNDNLLETRPLPRPVTDCFNDGEGIFVGGSGLELGIVRYYPRVMTATTIRELLSTGDTLADIATGSNPLKVENSEISVVGSTLGASLSTMGDSIDETQTLSQVDRIAAMGAASTGTAASPVGPFGAIPANSTMSHDSTVNRNYYSLLMGPYLFTETTQDADHRYIDQVPSFLGTGMTLSWWYRHYSCTGLTCGVYLYSAYDDNTFICWSLWLENDAIWIDNPNADPNFHYPKRLVDLKYHLSGDTTWRHLAVQLDETNNYVKFFLDGYHVWEDHYGSTVGQADCVVNKKMTIGRRNPLYTYGAPVQVYDMRMYVHTQFGNPLTNADLLAIASAPTPGIDSNSRCVPLSALKDSGGWSDMYGHGCDWYHTWKNTVPAICQFDEASTNCPIGCRSRQECYTQRVTPNAYFTWDRIRRIESRSQNGTICLGDEDSKEDVVQRCKTWIEGGGSIYDPEVEAWVDSLTLSGSVDDESRGRRINVTVCDALEEAIDVHCAFNQSAVRQFTQETLANGGDFTIAFWIRPLGLASLIRDINRFIPHLQFYSSLSPPLHPLALGLWQNDNGEFRFFSSCARGPQFIYENVEIRESSSTEWTFIAMTRANSSDSAGILGEYEIATNIMRNFEGSNMPICLYDESSYFKYLEFNYDALISPIMMVPAALPFAAVQEQYFTWSKSMYNRNGPLVSEKQRIENSTIDLKKQDYFPRSALMAPPLLFQTRARQTTQCSNSYSSEFIEKQHLKVVESKCSDPYKCDDVVVNNPEMVISCMGGAVNQVPILDMNPVSFDGKTGYADFLQSITDNEFLYRDSEVVQTRDIVNSTTEFVRIALVYFTPKAGIVSVLTISADFAGTQATQVTVRLQHFETLEGSNLTYYLVVQIMVLVAIVFMGVGVAYNLRALVYDLTNPEPADLALSRILQLIADCSAGAMIVVFLIIRIPQLMKSAGVMKDILAGLVEIPWEDSNAELVYKQETFFDRTKELLQIMETESTLGTFCFVLLILALLRVIAGTSVHPRLAVLTGTIWKAVDDLWHTLLLVILIQLCFGAISTWRFGTEREEFGTIFRTLQTQFVMMFGRFPKNWSQTVELQVYTVLFSIIVHLLIQSFILAIIVDAYMNVRKDIVALLSEQEFFTDVYSSVRVHVYSVYYGWPIPGRMGSMLDTWTSRYSVGFRELYETGLFRNQLAVARFIKYYERYDFLEPVHIKNYAPPKSKDDEMIDNVDRRLCDRFGVHVETLREMADREIINFKKKKMDKIRDGTMVRTASADEEPEWDTEIGPEAAAFAIQLQKTPILSMGTNDVSRTDLQNVNPPKSSAGSDRSRSGNGNMSSGSSDNGTGSDITKQLSDLEAKWDRHSNVIKNMERGTSAAASGGRYKRSNLVPDPGPH